MTPNVIVHAVSGILSSATKINKHSTKAIIAKAEALYNLGQFEKALVQFERGWRFRQDLYYGNPGVESHCLCSGYCEVSFV